MKIGYANLGRTIWLREASWGHVGGNAEVKRLLHQLATRREDDEFVLIGRNTGENPQEVGLPANVTNPWTEWTGPELMFNGDWGEKTTDSLMSELDRITRITRPWFEDLDAIIIWTGQHAAVSYPIPKARKPEEFATPLASAFNYCAYLIDGLNYWQNQDESRDPIWLNPDHRNYLKMRDLKHIPQHPVLSQYCTTVNQKFYRYGDDEDPPADGKWDKHKTCWKVPVEYEYAGLELAGIPDIEWDGWEIDSYRDILFTVAANDHGRTSGVARTDVLTQWVEPLLQEYGDDVHVYGKYPKDFREDWQESTGMALDSLRYADYWDQMRRTKYSIAMPAAGWPTARFWENAGLGVIMFCPSYYDEQGHILPTELPEDYSEDVQAAKIATWLRVSSPGEMMQKIQWLEAHPDVRYQLCSELRNYFVRMKKKQLIIDRIDERLEG